MDPPAKPSVLLVYYTHTQQTQRVVDAMSEVFSERDCDVSTAAIEFTDPRYREKFDRFPFKHALLDLLAVLPGDSCDGRRDRSRSLLPPREATTTSSASGRRRGSSPPTCPSARI